MNGPQEIWAGLAEVSIEANCDLDLEGAGSFVWCATQAQDKEGFSRKIEVMLAFYGLHLVELQRVCRFNEVEDPSEELAEMAERVAENEDFVLYGTFYTYPHHTT
ncbi:MAG TPA: hypothetical protein VGG59_00055 [Acidobacteriaceae bacterium]